MLLPRNLCCFIRQYSHLFYVKVSLTIQEVVVQFLICLQEMMAFQSDRSVDVRKFVVGFLEEAWYVLKSTNYLSVDPVYNKSSVIL